MHAVQDLQYARGKRPGGCVLSDFNVVADRSAQMRQDVATYRRLAEALSRLAQAVLRT